ncbi:MAG: glycoside hydrolase family 38 C-terminal domain-containing protein [Microbacteriaceae bacterium]
MHDDFGLVQAQVERFVRERIRPALYRHCAPLTVAAWPVPGEPVPFATALDQEYLPFTVGQRWGPPWSTLWLHVTGTVPTGWDAQGTRPEVVVDLGFTKALPGFQAEATVYAPDGSVLKAIEPLNPYIPVGPAGSGIDLYLEAAANPNTSGDFSFEPTALGDPTTAGEAPLYRLNRLEVGLLDETVWELLQDIRTLTGLVDELSPALPRRAEILAALERALQQLDPADVRGSAAAGRAALAVALAQPAYASAHRIVAVGHAHIDSAWLWPVRETVRKVARTFSNVLALMDDDPDFVFTASSAQQYDWLRQGYPELFARVREQVAAGRFIPVGGMWVEADTNMPGGEALVRQFLAGTRFFREQFGVQSEIVWLPDSFGYSGALPQIARAAGMRWLLTQKLSWNDTDRMPHHTFWWEGIDGTRIFTHFPPVDSYGCELSAAELATAQAQFAEKGAANTSLAPFGWGDGGGGPTREMLAAAHRAHDLEGSPRVELGTAESFFRDAQAEYPAPPVWTGELYLQRHRGCYTSQARTKRGNRRSEHLLREAELWAATANIRLGEPYPYDQLRAAWETVLLQQFHDILPGSSIAWVHQEAERNYAKVAASLEKLIGHSIGRLAGSGRLSVSFNSGPYPRLGIPGLGAARSGRAPQSVVVEENGQFIMQNGRVRAVVDRRGLLVSVRELASNREVVPVGAAGNLLQLFRDTPTEWDAWDLEDFSRHHAIELTDADRVGITDDAHAVAVARSFGGSTVLQELSMDEESGAIQILTRVDWQESQKLLKLAFPLDVHAERAASEIQFGHVFRPTHRNTSWDAARFETVAHRWVHVGEPGFGVAVANDASYGHDIARSRFGAGTATTVRVSLLRAPLYPDPRADRGEHQFTVSLLAGAGIGDAIAEGYRLNLPLRTVLGGHGVAALLTIDNRAVVVESVKLAEDRSGDLVVRLYEALGSRARARVTVDFAYQTLQQTDLLERQLPEASALTEAADPAAIGVTLRPFQLVTLRFVRG